MGNICGNINEEDYKIIKEKRLQKNYILPQEISQNYKNDSQNKNSIILSCISLSSTNDSRKSVEIIDIKLKTLLGNVEIVQINMNDKILEVKRKIKEKNPKEFPNVEQQSLMFDGEALDDEKTVKDQYIDNRMTINLLVMPQCPKLDLFIKHSEWKQNKQVQIDTNKTVKDLKKIIKTLDSSLPNFEKISFFFEKEQLEDDKQLQSYEIQTNDILEMKIYDDDEDEFPIQIKTLQGIIIKHKFLSSNTILQVKNKLHEEDIAFPLADQQQLVFNAVLLEDEKTIKDYNIQAYSMLNLIINQEELKLYREKTGQIQITIKTTVGTTFKVIILSIDTIKEVKEKIKQKEPSSPPVDQQKLIFRGKNLENNASIKDCEIGEDALLFLTGKKHF